MKKNLDQWLAFLESNHPTEIDMGLERVQAVAQRMDLLKPAEKVILVAGTNGKGSTVTVSSQILQAMGKRVGSYMSPHLHVYNERVRIDGQPVTDELIVESFEEIDEARQNISLTYFEVGTLSALYIFKKLQVDVAVLEIGLGGRLDAVNIVNADGAAVTSIGLDHQDWLGSDIEQIAFEKAGVYRADLPAICGQRNPPQALVSHANSISAVLSIKGQQFDFIRNESSWNWSGVDVGGSRLDLDNLPIPALPLENAATALQLLIKMFPEITRNEIERGLQSAHLDGRLQRFQHPFNGVMDVGHNPQAAELLNTELKTRPLSGKRYGVLAMLKDKDAASVVQQFDQVDHWFIAGLQGYRGQTVSELNDKVANIVKVEGLYDSVAEALDGLLDLLTENDEVVVFGSFVTVAQAQDWLSKYPMDAA